MNVFEVPLKNAPWTQLRFLLNECFPRPPQNVYQLVISSMHGRHRLWLAKQGDSLVGMVMLSPHSKGGHLENLAVVPRARSFGVGSLLVNSLLASVAENSPAMVSLTTRIPEFFLQFGFRPSGTLADGSTIMLAVVENKTDYDSISA